MAEDWKVAETKHWIESVSGPSLGAFCFGLLFKTCRMYIQGELSGWKSVLFFACLAGIYIAHRYASTLSTFTRQKVCCYAVVEAVQIYICLISLATSSRQSITNAIASTILCLIYQVNLFNSNTEVVFVLVKHYTIWYGIALYFGDSLAPFGLFIMVIIATIRTKSHKQETVKELYRKNKMLEEQDTMMDNLLQTIPDGVLILAENKSVHFYNKELLDTFSLRRVEDMPALMEEMEYEPDMKGYASSSYRLLDDILAFVHSSHPQQTFGTTKWKDEYFEWRGSRCMWKGLRACILIVRNNTNWIRMQDKMKLESAYKSSLIRSVSHELRTPTNAIINLTREVSDRSDLPDSCKEDLELVSVCSQFLLSMINDLLDFSKVLAGKFTLLKREFDIRDELKYVQRLFTPQCRVKGLELRLNIDPTIPRFVYSDPTRFKQVILNLLSNAVKFTMKGSIKILVTAERRGFIRIAVSDTGIGIAEEKQKAIFRLFGKLEGNEMINPQGSGLGLGISNLLAAELGGNDIRLTSTPGLGSTFTFHISTFVYDSDGESPLPSNYEPTFDIPDELQLPLAIPKLQNSGSDLSKIAESPQILVVDDNEFNRLVMSKMLASFSLRCEEAASGLQALILIEREAQRSHFFTLILMDLEMPEMDGMTAAHRILDMVRREQLPEDTFIVACSGYCSMEDKTACERAGMSGYLEKPVSKDVLGQLLRRLSLTN